MADSLKQALEVLESRKKAAFPDLEWMGLREVRETSTMRYARDGKPQANETSLSHGVMVEVLAHGQFGYSATSRLDAESLVIAAGEAYRQAEKASKRALFRFTAEQRPPVKTEYASPVSVPFSKMSAGEVNAILVDICHKLKRSPKIIRTAAYAEIIESETRFVSSNGSDARQKFSMIVSDFEATAQAQTKEGNVVQKRSDAGMRGRSYQGGWEFFKTSDLWDRVEKVSEQALELLTADECPTETSSLVLMPDQMMLQIHESIGHPLELDRILGDERNYAGWSFVGPHDFGKLQYGSPLMNVTFDPTIPHEFASYAFDDIGNQAKREYLIKDGLLLRGLGGLESQVRSGLLGVANQRASMWNRPPIDRMANLNLEPGESSFDEIIGSVERGVLMMSNRSWSIDDFRNKFQFGCEYAKRIENGKITKTLRNPNYRGITNPFWRGLKRVGNADTRKVFGTPNCGKGEPNQVIRVGHASPVCLFENVEIFGGAS